MIMRGFGSWATATEKKIYTERGAIIFIEQMTRLMYRMVWFRGVALSRFSQQRSIVASFSCALFSEICRRMAQIIRKIVSLVLYIFSSKESNFSYVSPKNSTVSD